MHKDTWTTIVIIIIVFALFYGIIAVGRHLYVRELAQADYANKTLCMTVDGEIPCTKIQYESVFDEYYDSCREVCQAPEIYIRDYRIKE